MQQQDKITNLQSRVFNNKKEYNFLDVYHTLMSSYGYIPFEEYLKMDAGVVDELMNRICKDSAVANQQSGIKTIGRKK